MREPLVFLEKMFRDYGDVARVRILNLRVCSIAHPEGIKHVLQENHRNYRKSFDYKMLARLLGQGLVTSEGSLWLRQRRLIQPMFHRQKVAGFGTLMAECTQTCGAAGTIRCGPGDDASYTPDRRSRLGVDGPDRTNRRDRPQYDHRQ
jgi:cytochrome P450